MLGQLKNIRDYQVRAKEILPADVYSYLDSGADDLYTYERNHEAYKLFQIRPRQLVDVSQVDTCIRLFEKNWKAPIGLSPVGFQSMFHPEAELATVRAAKNSGVLMIASTFSDCSFGKISKESGIAPWFQLYPTTNRSTTKLLLESAESNGCEVIVLTTDTPVLGNREFHVEMLSAKIKEQNQLGNFRGLGLPDLDPSLTWDFISWLRSHSKMKIVLKGILTREDAELCLMHGVDGIMVSNHGGRQLESGLSTIECLEEVVEGADSQIPVLIDGGIRRGTDIFKCLALGAKMVFIGRAYIYGLCVGGQTGVENVLRLLHEDLVRNMQLAGTASIKDITRNFVRAVRL